MNSDERLERAATRLWHRDNEEGKFRDASEPEKHWMRYDAKEIIKAWLGDDTMVLVHCEHFEGDAVCDVMCEAYVNGEGWMPLVIEGET